MNDPIMEEWGDLVERHEADLDDQATDTRPVREVRIARSITPGARANHAAIGERVSRLDMIRALAEAGRE